MLLYQSNALEVSERNDASEMLGGGGLKVRLEGGWAPRHGMQQPMWSKNFRKH